MTTGQDQTPGELTGYVSTTSTPVRRRPPNFKWKDEAEYQQGRATYWRNVAIVACLAFVVAVVCAVTK